MLAWMVDTLPQFGQDYVRLLSGNTVVPEQFDVHAEAQKTVAKGKIDLIIYTDTGVNFICEHKVDSGLRDHQLDDYRECIPEICDKYRSVTGDNASYSVVLVTRTENQSGQNPDKQLIWHDVYEYFNERLDTYDAKEKLVVKEFLLYLTEEDMGMMPSISIQGVKHYFEAMKLEDSLKAMFQDLASNVMWQQKCEGIASFVSEYSPTVVSKRWGRIGIDFASRDWDKKKNLNIFAGVLLDNRDHKIKYFNNEPTLVLMIEQDPKLMKNLRQTPKFQNIIKNAFEIEKESAFQMETDPTNEWRGVILEKPLSKVLVDDGYEKQKECIVAELINGINLLLK